MAAALSSLLVTARLPDKPMVKATVPGITTGPPSNSFPTTTLDAVPLHRANPTVVVPLPVCSSLFAVATRLQLSASRLSVSRLSVR